MSDVFLSYSREDQATVRRYAEALEREGFKVWWDDALNPGETFDQVTEQALKQAKAVVVLWSRNSVTSRWVRSEATQADRFGTLVPVMIEACDRPILFELSHTSDLSAWTGDRSDEKWRSFVSSLKRLIAKDGKYAASPVTREMAVAPLPTAAPASQSRRMAFRWAGAAAVLVALGTGLVWYALGRSTSETEADGLTGIAVLPFDDLSAEKNQQHFGDGIAEEILNQLARIGPDQLRVIARNSSFAFRGGNQNLKQVGESLGVDHLLEGSVRKSGDQLRITAQLISTKTDAHLWSKTYERPLTDIFSIQDEIARSVAEALQISLGVGIGGRPGMTRDVEAYEAYLEAQNFSQVNANTMRRSMELLQQAVAKDPTFALSWVALAESYGASSALIQGSNPKDLQARSEAALAEAVRLQPDLPEANASLTWESMRQGNWKEAMVRAEAYEAAAKKYGVQESLKANLLTRVGRFREALPLLEAYKARDPLNPVNSSALIEAYSATGNLPAAYSELKRVYGTGEGPPSTFIRLSALQLALGSRNRELLLRAVEDGIVSDARQNVRFYVHIKDLLDKPDELIAFMRGLVLPEGGAPGLIGAAWFLAYHGDAAGALEAIQILGKRPGGFTSPIWSPVFAEMRKLPGFKQLVQDQGLVDYWKTYGWGDFCSPIQGTDDFECE